MTTAPAKQPTTEDPRHSRWNPAAWPLYLQVLSGVLIGGCIGMAFGTRELAAGWTTADLGAVANLYIQLLTAMATPLIFFAIVDAFVHTQISGRDGLKMLVVCTANVAVAFAIGLTILNVWEPGRTWYGQLAQQAAQLTPEANATADGSSPAPPQKSNQVSLSPLDMARSYVPRSIVQPFAENMVLTVAVLACLVGAAMRGLKQSEDAALCAAMATFEQVVVACYQIVLAMLRWLIRLAPYAICMAVAGVVGAVGISVFRFAGVFFLTVSASLAIHALIYYPLSAWWIGGKSPRVYFGEGAGAILTGFSINSSLATAPLTLEALHRMRVSESSARLSACLGTNFNNDGITLYEAITALFVAQAAGMMLSADQQITVLLAALAGSMGIAGIPNSGLIILTLVLKAARLPEETVALALPIVYSIDFINARLRSAVNVMGDMQVAILIDVGKTPGDQP